MIEDDGLQAAAPTIGLLERISPAGVRVALDVAREHFEIAPEEEEALSRAEPIQRAMFGTGRGLARRLATDLGIELGAIPNEEGGAPVWPPGIIGSFSYKELWCAVAVCKSDNYLGLGIDLDRVSRPPRDSWAGICSSEELSLMGDVAPAVAVDLLFSAKEAFFKAQYCITRHGDLEMDDVFARVNPTTGHFSIDPALAGVRCLGQVALAGGWCAACVALQALKDV